ncbi:MAG: AMP-binding protein [Candidatus Eisenbacteria bacterium]
MHRGAVPRPVARVGRSLGLRAIPAIGAPGTDALALVEGDRSLRYDAPLARAESGAARLYAAGARRHEVIAVLLERSIEQVASILAIARPGATPRPLDPAYPDARASARRAGVTRSSRRVRTRCESEVSARRSIRTISSPQPAGGPPHRSPYLLHAAYLIFTSGSTGELNGVLVSEANLDALIAWHLEAFALTSRDRTTLLAGVGLTRA